MNLFGAQNRTPVFVAGVLLLLRVNNEVIRPAHDGPAPRTKSLRATYLKTLRFCLIGTLSKPRSC